MPSAPDRPSQALTAAEAVLRVSVPDSALLPPSMLDSLVVAQPNILSALPHREHRVVAAGMIRSKAHTHHIREALELADFEADSMPSPLDLELSSTDRSLCHAALAEAYVNSGFTQKGTTHARRALSYAEEARDDFCIYRACGLLAQNFALNGEFNQAEREITRGKEIEQRHPRSLNDSSMPLFLAEVTIAYSRLDSAALAAACERISTAENPIPAWTLIGRLATTWLHMLRQEYDQALVCVSALTTSPDLDSLPTLVGDFAFGAHAMTLINRGDPARALNLLQGRITSVSHAVCLDLQRATAYLQLGQDREALQTTDGCLRLGTRHSRRTLPSILLRRAVANHRLGHAAAADGAFAEAFLMMDASGSMVPLMGVPEPEVRELFTQLVARRPEFAGQVKDLQFRAKSRPRSNTPSTVLSILTKREIEAARRLRSDEPLREIAAELHVSPNTLKTQLRSIYAKLAVGTRREAVLKLESIGFYEWDQ